MLPGIVQATADYERWASTHIRLQPGDLKLKHERMAASPLGFLRGSFYRFMQRWPDLVGAAGSPPAHLAPLVPSVGDIHLENFGTWRDAYGRLVWGVNDFDEAATLPYTLDLLRLSISARLAAEAGEVSLPVGNIPDAILSGYQESLERGGQPFVLEAEHGWLRQMVTDERDATDYWAKLNGLPSLPEPSSRRAVQLLRQALPAGAEPVFAHRVVGLGSLGRVRLLARCDWLGGPLAFEAKALLPSAASWVHGLEGAALKQAAQAARCVLTGSVRSPDPTLRTRQGFVLRRLSPSVQKINLADLSRARDERRLLQAMGAELANVHLGAPELARPVLRDLRGRGHEWFGERIEQGAEEVQADWNDWKRR